MNKNVSWTYNEEFEKHGFFVIKRLLNPEFLYSEIPDKSLKNTQTEYDVKSKKYFVEKDKDSVINSTSRYNFPPYVNIHQDIKLILEDFIGRKLYKTYVYDRFYFSNSELKEHIDRPQCEISCTVHVSSNVKNPWYFNVKSLQGETASIDLNPGDAVVYKGCQVSHWRNTLPSNYGENKKKNNDTDDGDDDTYYHQVFFHHVLQDGNYVQFIN